MLRPNGRKPSAAARKRSRPQRGSAASTWLAARGEAAAWREVEHLIELRNASGYEQAVALLTDLRELARIHGRLVDFGGRLADMRRRHERKRGFRDRLRASGLS